MHWQTCCVTPLKHMKLKETDLLRNASFLHSQVSLSENKSDVCITELLHIMERTPLGLRIVFPVNRIKCVCFVRENKRREKQKPDPWKRGRKKQHCEIKALWRWNWIYSSIQNTSPQFIHIENYTENSSKYRKMKCCWDAFDFLSSDRWFL